MNKYIFSPVPPTLLTMHILFWKYSFHFCKYDYLIEKRDGNNFHLIIFDHCLIHNIHLFAYSKAFVYRSMTFVV